MPAYCNWKSPDGTVCKKRVTNSPLHCGPCIKLYPAAAVAHEAGKATLSYYRCNAARCTTKTVKDLPWCEDCARGNAQRTADNATARNVKMQSQLCTMCGQITCNTGVTVCATCAATLSAEEQVERHKNRLAGLAQTGRACSSCLKSEVSVPGAQCAKCAGDLQLDANPEATAENLARSKRNNRAQDTRNKAAAEQAPEGTKWCIGCHLTLPVVLFPPHASSRKEDDLSERKVCIACCDLKSTYASKQQAPFQAALDLYKAEFFDNKCNICKLILEGQIGEMDHYRGTKVLDVGTGKLSRWSSAKVSYLDTTKTVYGFEVGLGNGTAIKVRGLSAKRYDEKERTPNIVKVTGSTKLEYQLDLYRTELHKTQLLCASCHRVKTNDEIASSGARAAGVERGKRFVNKCKAALASNGSNGCQCGRPADECHAVVSGVRSDHPLYQSSFEYDADEKNVVGHVLISKMVGSQASNKRIALEIAKCKLLHRSCHKAKTATQLKVRKRLRQADARSALAVLKKSKDSASSLSCI